MKRFYRVIAMFLVVLEVSTPVVAAPFGGVVTHGGAAIDTSTAGVTRIVQSTDRAIINWGGFSTAAGEAVRFEQSPGAAVLNRVTGNQASVLAGTLSASGKVLLLNPNGILFAAGSRTDVGGLVASTLALADDDFLSDHWELKQGATPLTSVINRGQITAVDGGLVALVAPVVSNEGEIKAAMGRVVLGAATHATLSPDGAGLINLALPEGQAGEVALTGEATGATLAAAVREPRIVEGGDVVERDGRVFLTGAEGLALNAGTIDVSGPQGGGRVEVQGTRAAVVAGGSRIHADGTAGHAPGGSVTVKSAGVGVLAPGAHIGVRGAGQGRGGFIEVSGARDVAVAGTVDLASDEGAAGELLIDPDTLTIVAGALGTGTPTGCGSIFFATNPNNAGGPSTVTDSFIESVTSGTIILQAEQALTVGTSLTLLPDVSLVLQTRGETPGVGIAWTTATDLVSVTGAGTLRIEAGTDPTTGNASDVVIGTLRSSGGSIVVNAGVNGGSITMGDIDAGTGAVFLTSVNGNIVGTAGRAIAQSVVIRADTGIGTAAAPVLTSALNLDARSLTSGEVAIDNDPATPVTVSALHTGAGDITFNQTGGGPLTVISAFTGDGSIAIDNQGTNLTVVDAIAAAGTGGVALSVSAGDLVTTGQISGAGAAGVTLTNAAGGVRTGGIVESLGGALGITAPGGIEVNGPLSAAAGLTLDAANGAAAGGALTVRGALSGATVSLLSETALTLSGAVTAGGAVTINNTDGDGTAGDDLVIDGSIDAAGAIAIASVNGGITTRGRLATTGANAVSLISDGFLRVLGDVDSGDAVTAISANGGDLTVASTVSGTAGTLTGAGALVLDGRGDFTGAASLASQTDRMVIRGSLAANGAVTLNSAAAIEGPGQVTSGTSVTVSGGAAVGATDAVVFTAPVLDISSTGAGDVVATSVNAGATAVTLTQTNGGNIRFTHSGGGALSVAGATTSAGGIDIRDTGSSLTVTGAIAAAGGNVTLATLLDGNLAVDAALTAGAGSTVTLDAADQLTAAALITGDNLILRANEGIGGAGTLNFVSLTLDAVSAVSGDVTLATSSALATTVSQLVARGAGNVAYTKAGTGATTVELVSAQTGAATVSASGQLTVNRAVALTGAVTLTGTGVSAADVTSGAGNVSVTATAGPALVDRARATAGAITVNATGGAAVARDLTAGGVVALNSNAGVTVAGRLVAGTVNLTALNASAIVIAGEIASPTAVLSANAAGAISLSGTTDVLTANLNAGTAIDGAGLLSANTAALAAQTGIGATTALTVVVDALTATTAAGAIDIDSTNARAVTATASVTAGAGGISLVQTGGGALSVTAATTTDGAIALANAGADLTIGGAVTGGGAGDVSLRASGNLVIAGDVTAAGDAVALEAGGSITGANLLSAASLTITAGTAAGDLLVGLSSAASVIQVIAGSGGIHLSNDSAVAVLVDSLTAASGPIRYSQVGAGDVTFTDVITGAGDIALTGQAGVTVGNLIDAGGAGTTAAITAGAAINGSIGGRVIAETVTLQAQSGIGDPTVLATDAGFLNVTNGAAGAVSIVNAHNTATQASVNTASAAGGITLTQAGGGALILGNTSTTGGAIDVAVSGADLVLDGSLTAGGANGVNLTTTGAGDVALGGVVDAAGDAVVLTAAGDVASAPGAGVVAGSVTATAGGTVTLGGVNAATVAASASGDLVVGLASAAAVNLPTLTAGGSGDVVLTQTGAGAVTLTTVSTANGDVQLSTGGGTLTVGGSIVAGGAGDVRITSGGHVVLTGTTTAQGDPVSVRAGGSINGAGAITAGAVDLTATLGIGNTTQLVLAAPVIAAVNGTNAIALTSGLASPVRVANLTNTGVGAITLVHTGGTLTVDAVSAFNGATAVTATAGALTTGTIVSGAGSVSLAATGGALTAGPITTGAGAIALTATSANLDVVGALIAGGAGPVTLTTNTSGDIRVMGDVTAAGDTVTVNSAGAIEGGGLLTGATAALIATGAIGAGSRFRVNVGALSASSTAGGDVLVSSSSPGAVDVTALSAAAGSIDLDHSGGLLSVDAATATAGSISFSSTGGLAIDGAVSAGGSGSVLYETLLSGDIQLSGPTTATSDAITVRSAGGISGAGRLTAGRVDLDAAAGIGSTAALTVSAPVVTADTTGAGGISINSNLAGAVTVTSLTAGGAGAIFFGQTGGGPLTIGAARTVDGSVQLSSDTGRLLVEGQVITGNQGNVLINTFTGNVVLAGSVAAPGAAATIRSGGNITGGGLISASSITLTALFGMGSSAEPLNLAAPNVSASSTSNGSVFLDSTLDDPVIASLLSVGGQGDVQFEQRGGGSLTVGIVTAAAGSVRLANLSPTPADLTLGTVVASGEAALTASSGEISSAFGGTNVTAASVTLRAGRGIGTGTPLTTAARIINAEAGNGSVNIEQGGAVDLENIEASDDIVIANASGDIRLGTLRAGRMIQVTARGSIFTLDPALTNLTTFGRADNRLSAAGVIGLSCDLPVRVNIDGTLTIAPGGAINGISADLAGEIRPSGAFVLANSPPGAVLFDCRPAASGFTQEQDRANPGTVFQPYGFDLTSPYTTTAESRFDTSLRGLIRTRDAWDERWTDELTWEDPAAREAAELAQEERELEAEREAIDPRASREARKRQLRALESMARAEDDEDAPPEPPRRPRAKPRPAPDGHKTARVDRLRDLWQEHASARDEEDGTL